MQKSLVDIFNEAGAKELDIVLDKCDDMADELDALTIKRIKTNVFAKADLKNANTKKKRPGARRWKTMAAAVAACFALLVVAGV